MNTKENVEKAIKRFYNSYFMVDVSLEVKCIGRVIENGKDIECPFNKYEMSSLSWERDHIDSKICNMNCDWHTIKKSSYYNNQQHSVANIQIKAPLDRLYYELINRVRFLCPSHHNARKGNPRRDRTRNIMDKKIRRLKEIGIEFYIPSKSEIHERNLEIITRLYKEYKDKPIPENTFVIAKQSNGIDLTPKLIMDGIKLRRQGLGSYKIADKLGIKVSTCKRYIPTLNNLLLLKRITKVDGVEYG